MQYLHTMLRIRNVEESLDFFCNALDMVETNRIESQKGRFTLIFLAAKADIEAAKQNKAPLLELTYNWPDASQKEERYSVGRSFGHIAYRVDNIYATCKKLVDLGIAINRPPSDGSMAFIKTPDGISIELLQKGDALAPQEPWLSMPKVGSW